MAVTDEERREVRGHFGFSLKTFGVIFPGGILLALAIAWTLAEGRGLGSPTKPTYVLYPSFVLFFLVAAVLTRMGTLRVSSVLNGSISMRFYRTYDEGEEPEHLRVVTRHFINLFEMPLLLHVVVILAYVTGQVTCLLVGLAWSYALLRVLHTAIHLGGNNVPMRLAAYASSGLVLLATWVTLLARLLSAVP